jgi:hypothetical protein
MISRGDFSWPKIITLSVPKTLLPKPFYGAENTVTPQPNLMFQKEVFAEHSRGGVGVHISVAL